MTSPDRCGSDPTGNPSQVEPAAGGAPAPGTVIVFPRPGPDSRTGTGAGPDPKLRQVVGEVLRQERLHQGRTLSDVAGAASVSLPYLSEIERGRKEVSSDVLDAVIRALDLELVDVLDRAAHRLRFGAQGHRTTLVLAA